MASQISADFESRECQSSFALLNDTDGIVVVLVNFIKPPFGKIDYLRSHQYFITLRHHEYMVSRSGVF